MTLVVVPNYCVLFISEPKSGHWQAVLGVYAYQFVKRIAKVHFRVIYRNVCEFSTHFTSYHLSNVLLPSFWYEISPTVHRPNHHPSSSSHLHFRFSLCTSTFFQLSLPHFPLPIPMSAYYSFCTPFFLKNAYVFFCSYIYHTRLYFSSPLLYFLFSYSLSSPSIIRNCSQFTSVMNKIISQHITFIDT